MFKHRLIRVGLAILLSVLFSVPASHAGPGGGECTYWDCRLADDGSASCWWATFGGNYALECKVVCDRYEGYGGCWCEYPGACYMI